MLRLLMELSHPKETHDAHQAAKARFEPGNHLQPSRLAKNKCSFHFTSSVLQHEIRELPRMQSAQEINILAARRHKSARMELFQEKIMQTQLTKLALNQETIRNLNHSQKKYEFCATFVTSCKTGFTCPECNPPRR